MVLALRCSGLESVRGFILLGNSLDFFLFPFCFSYLFFVSSSKDGLQVPACFRAPARSALNGLERKKERKREIKKGRKKRDADWRRVPSSL